MIRPPVDPTPKERHRLIKFAIGIRAGYTCKSVGSFAVIPQTFRLVIIENKRLAIRPPTGSQRDHLVVNFSAVHGSQSDKWSPPDGHVDITKGFVHNLMKVKMTDPVGSALSTNRRANDKKSLTCARVTRFTR